MTVFMLKKSNVKAVIARLFTIEHLTLVLSGAALPRPLQALVMLHDGYPIQGKPKRQGGT
jgi:hypothetical protein